MSAPGWNPRFVLYATSQGRKPQEQIDHDKTAWPGGCMCGFILWMAPLIRGFKDACPEHCVGDMIRNQDAFDLWLARNA